MQLAQLLPDLPRVVAQTGDLATPVTAIVADSRRVTPGALFVAYRGIEADGHCFISDAIARGAVAVVGELPAPADVPVPYIQVPNGREALAWLAATWYGHPSHSMALVGITGTDGKTTTANLLFSILRVAGRHAGLISTVHAVIGDQFCDTGLHTTTPDAPDVQRYLAQMRDAGTEIAVLEVTSHGLAQHRVTGCAFDVAVITNITHEHLDFHGSYEAYREAKALLFRSLTAQKPGHPKKTGLARLPKTAILNRDDGSFAFLAAIPAERVITYGVGGEKQQGKRELKGWWDEHREAWDLAASNVRHTPAGLEFDIMASSPPGHPATFSPPHLLTLSPYHLTTPLIGTFNVYNVLAATAAALVLDIGLDAIRAGVAAMRGVPGRMERVDRGQPFAAIVDFAHTPNALAHALETARTLARPDGRVIAVFGCAGLRDREKRRLMGEVASGLADLTVITAEDPRTESLTDIMAETAQAMTAAGRVEGQDFVRIPDRQRAILYAVRQAQPGDVVLICGKGHEQSMCFGTVEYPWRDQDALVWALDVLAGAAEDTPPFVLPTWAPNLTSYPAGVKSI